MEYLLFIVLAYCACFHVEAFSSRTAQARPLKCGETGKFKFHEMQSPPLPPEECVYKIQPLNLNVCQLRVDFNVIMEQPSVPKDNGSIKCEFDSFTIAGLELCGFNTNQHVYIPVNVTRESLRQTIEFKLKVADRKANPMLNFVMWNIRVTQLECTRGAPGIISGKLLNDSSSTPMARTLNNDIDLLAPYGCLQYYPEPEGTIESFNFNSGNGPYPANLNYAICLHRRQGNSKIEFTFVSFHLSSGKSDADGFDENCLSKSIPASGKPGDKLPDPSEDYLMIPSATTANQLRVNKFCGKTVNEQTVTADAPGPYVLQFHSDNKFKAPDAKAKEGGFKIKYKIQ